MFHSTYLRSELIIIGWPFMHESNISLPPLSLARFFLAQQLIHKKSKIEKHNVRLDIFVSDTSITRKLHLPGEIAF